jgi:hypothetical protein
MRPVFGGNRACIAHVPVVFGYTLPHFALNAPLVARSAYVIRIVFALLVSAALPRTDVIAYAARTVDAQMVGGWCGTAEITNAWVTARDLDVRIAIAADGAVSGRVGDATLNDAQFRKNGNFITRALHVFPGWIIRGKLVGDIVAADGITRQTVKLPLDFGDTEDGRGFFGTVRTNGLPGSGAGTASVAATRLVLTRCHPE